MNMPSYASTSVAQQLRRGMLTARAAPTVPNMSLLRDSTTSPGGATDKEESFWDKYKLWLLGGAGVVAVGGLLYWSKKR